MSPINTGMYDDLENRMASIAETAASQIAAPHWGIIASYNPNNHTAKVTIPPDNILTDELPIKTAGFRYAPTVGQMAFLIPENQDSQALVINGFAFNDLSRPPSTNTEIGGSPSLLNPGEFEVLGPNGSSHRFNADGSAYMAYPKGLDLNSNVNMAGNMNQNGNQHTTGNLTVGTGATGSFTTPTGQIVTVQDGIITNIF